MTTPVIVALKAEGVADVKAELRSIKAAYMELEAFSLAATQRGSKARLAILKAEVETSRDLLAKLRAEESFSAGIGRLRGNGAQRAMTPAASGGGSVADGLLGNGASAVMNGAVGLFKGALDMATNALKQFGGFVLSDVVKPALELQTKAQQVANQSGGSLTAADVQGKARAVGLRNNMDPSKLIDAAGVLQDKTGDAAMSFDLLKVIGTLSKGRGYDPKQLAGMAASVHQEGMSTADIETALLTMTGQGDKGSIPLGEMARLGGKFTKPAASFAGDYASRLAMSGALLQTGRKGFGSTDATATGLDSFTKDALKLGKLFSPGSIVKVAGADKVADPAKLMGDIFRKTSGDVTTLKKMTFSDPGASFVGAYQERFAKTYGAATASGKDEKTAREEAARAVEEYIRSFTNSTSSMQSESAKRDAVMRTDGERWDSAVNLIKDRLLAVMPQITTFVTAFSANAPVIASAAVTLAKALLYLAQLILNLLPQTDTREKRRMESEIATAEKSTALQGVIAKGKAEGKDMYREESELLKLGQERDDLAGGKVAKAISREDVLAKIGDTVDNRALLAGIEAEPDRYDIREGERTTLRIGRNETTLTDKLSSEGKDIVASYRDEKLTQYEGNIKAGAAGAGGGIQEAADKVAAKALSETAAAAANLTKQLEAAAGATGAINRTKAFGKEG